MKEISKSSDRHTFQINSYLKNCERENKVPDEVQLKILEMIKNQFPTRFQNRNLENDLEYDLLTTDWILEKVRGNTVYSQHLYAAICNNQFLKNDVIPIIKEDYCSYSWRYAGGIIADMRQEGDYIDWYCSGYLKGKDYVPESTVTDEIRDDLFKLGWIVVDTK